MTPNKTCGDLIAHAQQLPPVRTAVVHPVTEEALLGAIEAEKCKLITPIFVGPVQKIKKIAKQLNIDLSPYEIISTEHSHAAAEKSVELIHRDQADMLMKGSLHTDEFMQAILDKENGLRTDRRMSHVYAIETAAYSKLILLTDCAINIAPTLLEKRDIAQNAIDLAIAIGIKQPKLAALSAVETITDKIPSTIEAAALCKMAERKQITGAIIDGPLAFDNAISEKAAEIKDIHSPVAGDADILLVPNIEAGNMLAKQMEYLTKAKLAGIVVGARVPIVLTSRSDPARIRSTSCALGILYGEFLRKKSCNKQS